VSINNSIVFHIFILFLLALRLYTGVFAIITTKALLWSYFGDNSNANQNYFKEFALQQPKFPFPEFPF